VSNPFDFVTAAGHTKQDLIAEDPDSEKDYVPFVTNRAFSYHADSLLAANEMNRLHHLDKAMQFKFLLNVLKPRKRYGGKWAKPAQVTEVEALMRVYGYGYREAEAALRVLAPEEIDLIRQAVQRAES
jgi:hypothetical protein